MKHPAYNPIVPELVQSLERIKERYKKMKNTPKQSKIPTASQAKAMTEKNLEAADKEKQQIWENEIEPYIADEVQSAIERKVYSHTIKLGTFGLQRWIPLAGFIVTRLREMGYNASCRQERSPHGACDIHFSWSGDSIASISPEVINPDKWIIDENRYKQHPIVKFQEFPPKTFQV